MRDSGMSLRCKVVTGPVIRFPGLPMASCCAHSAPFKLGSVTMEEDRLAAATARLELAALLLDAGCIATSGMMWLDVAEAEAGAPHAQTRSSALR